MDPRQSAFQFCQRYGFALPPPPIPPPRPKTILEHRPFAEMIVPNADDPSFRAHQRFACSASVELLRRSPDVARYMFRSGVIFVPTFVSIFEKTFNMKMTPEIFQMVVNDREIVFDDEKKHYIRATYGHSDEILAKMLERDYVVYRGYPNIFCLTHTSMDGLGAINSGRTFNVLYEPRFCQNKGVIAFVNVMHLRKNGIELWYKPGVNDRIFCFSPKLRDFVYHIEYSDEYTSESGLKRRHIKAFEFQKSSLSHLSSDDAEKIAMDRIKRLMITEDETEDGEDADILNAMEAMKISSSTV